MILSRCRMFKQKKFAVHFELFPVAFVDCSSNLVICRHFISLMSLFQRHVARRNLPYQGLIINSRRKSKYPPCTFLIDRAQQQKHVKVQVKHLKIATFFLQMLEKFTSAFNLTTKWKTYLTLGPNFMRCPTLQLTFPIVQPTLPPPSLKKATNVGVGVGVSFFPKFCFILSSFSTDCHLWWQLVKKN